MSVKRLRSEGVVRPVPQGPHDMVKAGLPEPQSPVGVWNHPPGRTPATRRHPLHWPNRLTGAFQMGGR